ncbi:hypothetical protein EV356DRAFT_517224 [Viridothelium virens]|uniref:Protein kinase domain-containing protein n=1 Tax=Viridothelium virens TaxID=1048519 RepID=A0A6A6H470_VIRVR|nr:hypothetical protein EV356DRAFT_517224 [Viridothelium virens]
MSEAKPAPTYSYDDFSIEPRYSFKEGRATLAKFYKLSEPRIVLIEWRDASTTDRNELTKLAAIMYGKRPIDVRVPYSYGLVMPSSRSQGRYGLILEPPAHIREFEEPKLEEGLVRYRMPITLSRMLLRTDGSKDIMELGTRFRLAKALVESVHTMHTCGWVHKNIRSESIIFFPPLSSTGSGPPKELPRQYDFDRPLLTGMDRARTDEPAERPDYNYDDEDYRANDIVLDIYQHPDKQIGLWQSLETFRSLDDSPQQFRDRILGEAAHLKGTAGAIYCNAVQECLRVDSAKCEAENQKRLCWKIAAEMDKCVA